MEKQRIELFKRLSDKINCEDYIPVIETDKGYYMIRGNKIAKSSRESRRRYDSYLESKGTDVENSRFDKLIASVELDSEKKKGIWFDLEGFTNNLDSENIELIKESIKKYK